MQSSSLKAKRNMRRDLLCALTVLLPWAASAMPPPAPTRMPAQALATGPYDLAALIDLAEQNSPETRQAWNEARAAAAAAGLARSAYQPQLALEALGGAQRTPLPAPSNLVPKGYFVSDTRELIPTVTVKWLLFDFGRRDAARDRADATAFVANEAFTGAHQTLVYAVSRDFYALGTAEGKRRAAVKNLETAEVDERAVGERRNHGVATSVEEARSQRQLAQARLALVRATGVVDVARATLIATIGLPAGTDVQVADTHSDALPLPPSKSVAGLVDEALAGRPDMVAAKGKLDAAEAATREARADYRPTVSAVGQVFYNDGRLRSDGGPWSSVHRPGGALFVQFTWTLFDGGMRRSKLAIARAEQDAARDAYDIVRDKAGRQVSEAFSSLRTALAEAEAASEVTRTATLSHDAALDAFRHGLGTFDELAAETSALATASADEESARADAYTAAAALALATGQSAGRSSAP